MSKILHQINGTIIEQNAEDGFLNATAMCAANNKKVKDWLRLESTFELFVHLAVDLGIKSNRAYSPLSGTASLSASKYVDIFPSLIIVKRGSPENGGGTWLHPDLALQLAQWCNAAFALQVSRWIREWMTTGQNPGYQQPQLTPESLIKICSDILAPTSLSNDLKATYLLRAVEAQHPESSNLIQKLLPGVQPKSDEEYISPTRLAQIYNDRTNSNIKAYQINLALEDAGLQTTYYTERTSTKTGKIKRTKCYSPTNLGSEYSTFVLDKAGSDKTVQLLRWKPSVLDQIAGILNNEI